MTNPLLFLPPRSWVLAPGIGLAELAGAEVLRCPCSRPSCPLGADLRGALALSDVAVLGFAF